MKKAILTALVVGTTSLASAQQLKMNIDVTNVQKDKGTVVVNVYDKKDNFLKTAYLTKVQKANQSTLKFQVDLPKGTYAITVFQDLDNDKKLTTNWIGIPKEPVGNSTNFKPDGGAPTFKDCAILVSKNDSTIAINLD
ncbi:DUF2141 domain-containing protein [Flavobacterium sp. F-65]|jgi:uncharacterized protein (DUF2141 family)|uniref:DUF2141 domain-containing protein n=1 Tax=Flavobacterium pisciphilum TaxID=2893755 RepID=A0ABS8N085_9FLAO|nr:DUF2141 domain-containing protein [Flavobacterium sp. F-65]MCC9074453.1 DUF2141 domain-containing protein [Flavobacterium sp. F-65]